MRRILQDMDGTIRGTQKRKRGRPRRNDPERSTLLADQPSDREDRQHSAIQMDVTRAHNNVVWHNLTRRKEYGRHTGSLQNDSARCWSHRALSYLHPQKRDPSTAFAMNPFLGHR